MGEYLFDKGQLLDLTNNEAGEAEDAEDIELEGIDMVTWENKNIVWVVL